MKGLLVCSIATFLFSCVTDKSKTVSEKMPDTIQNSASDSLPKVKNFVTNHPFQLKLSERSNWNIKIDSITDKEFDQGRKEQTQEMKTNGDSLISSFSDKFKDVIILADSCCILKGLDEDLKVCRSQPDDDREWAGYDAVGYERGFLILKGWGYESCYYISFNPVTRKYIYTENEPLFIDNNIMYAAGNYYAEGIFEIANLKEDKYFGFVTFNWELTGLYREESSILMEFTSRLKKKYLRVTFD